MILNADLLPFGKPPDQAGRSIRVSVDIEGRGYLYVTFCLVGFGDRVQIPKASVQVARARARAQAGFARTALLKSVGIPSQYSNGARSDVGRRDGLWRHTCFEVFAQLEDGCYAEFNISPSGEWAAYSFTGYREGMENLEGRVRLHRAERAGAAFDVEAILDWPKAPFIQRIGMSAVIEDTDGAISWWALAHPSDKPDFHHPDSFVLELP